MLSDIGIKARSSLVIRFSRYYLPFREKASSGFYFIPLDYKYDFLTGNHSSHVDLYLSQKTSIFDPLTKRFIVFDHTNPLASPMVSNNLITEDFLKDLYFSSGVKAAGRRLGLCP